MMHIDAVLEQFISLLGNESVIHDPQTVHSYSDSTTASRRKIAAILRPTSTEQVVQIVKIASQFKLSLYPISTGNNWGYGSANPVRDDCVVVDLSSMNKILVMDEKTGVVTVEPGVTQAILREYLDERGLDYLVPVTGAGPTCSLVGNAIERGYGITPYADHFYAITAMEVILPNGDIYQSALSAIGGKRVDQAFKWGFGPYLDGIFHRATSVFVPA